MSKQERLLFLSDLMLLAVAVVWGTSYGVVKSALVFYPVLGLLALRFGITFVILSPALRHLRAADARTLRGVLIAGVLLLGIFLCETFGILLTRAANAAFLISLCVVLTPLVEWQMLKRRPSRVEWVAVAVSLLGAWLLAGDGALSFNPGDALILLAALLRALTVCVTKRVMRDSALPPLSVTAVQSGVVASGSAAVACAVRAATVAGAADAGGTRVVLGLCRLSRAGVHAVRVLRAELRDQTQQSDAGVAVDGQRTGVWRAVRLHLARRKDFGERVARRRADRRRVDSGDGALERMARERRAGVNGTCAKRRAIRLPD